MCARATFPLDVVDLHRSCHDGERPLVPWSGTAVYYFLCDECGFCFAPEFRAWTPANFRERIYNEEYVRVDPDYVERRPRAMADVLRGLFPALPATARHLDFGSGNGSMTRLLREAGWNSVAHDPFDPATSGSIDGGPFELVSAFEVFEHSQDVPALARDVATLVADEGLIALSTMLSDGALKRGRRLDWWYAAPRNGHISLFSASSLRRLLEGAGLQVALYPHLGLHFAWRALPGWAAHVTRLVAAAA